MAKPIHLNAVLAATLAVVACAAAPLALAGAEAAAHADPPDVLAGITVAPQHHRYDYRRAAFGEGWDDGGSCDVRDQILNRDLVNVTDVSVKRCPDAVEAGTLNDPYTGKVIAFTRGPRSSEAVQIDHLVPLAYAWDAGAWSWSDAERHQFYFDPAELLAVDGQANQSKGDYGPGGWMPPNAAYACTYATKFTNVLRAYNLPIDPASAAVVQHAATSCPAP